MQSGTALAQADYALENIRIVSMRDGSLSRPSTLIIGQGAIRKVTPVARAAPRGMERVDGAGAYVIPGLVDAHVHLPSEAFAALLGLEAPTGAEQERDLTAYVAHGVTSLMVMSGTPGLLSLRDEVSDHRRMGPRLLIGSPFVSGAQPILPPPASRLIATPEAADALVGRLQSEGYDFVKLRNDLTPALATAAVAAAERRGMPVFGHLPDAARTIDDFFGASGAGAAHLYDLLQLSEAKAGDYAALARALRGRSARVVTTLSVHDNILGKNADFAATLKTPCADLAAPQMFALWRGVTFEPSSSSAVIAAQAKQQGRLLRALVDGGVPVLAGTDAGSPTVGPGCSLGRELELMVAAGLTPLEALRTATFTPAQVMDSLADGGEVVAGKRADLVLLRRNPLRDIRNLQDVTGVVLGGRWLSRSDLAAASDRARLRQGGEPRPADGLNSKR